MQKKSFKLAIHFNWHCVIPQSPPGVLDRSPTNSLNITTLPRFSKVLTQRKVGKLLMRTRNFGVSDELRPGEYPLIYQDSYMLGGWPWDF